MIQSSQHVIPEHVRQFPLTQASLERALVRLLTSVRSVRPKLLKDGSVSKRHLPRLAQDLSLHIPEELLEPEAAAELLSGIARYLGLMILQDGRLELSGPACDRFFAKPAAERLSAMRTAWLNSGDLNEFTQLETLEVSAPRGQSTVDRRDWVPGTVELKRARRATLDALANMPAEEWSSESVLPGQVRRSDPDFLVPEGSRLALAQTTYAGIRKRGAKADLDRAGNWNLVEGALIGRIARGGLPLLGWAEAASWPGGILLRPATSNQFSGTDQASRPALMVQPNFDVLALLPELSTQDLWRLARIATPTSYDSAAHFRIEEANVASAANDGTRLSVMLDWLASLSRTPIPQNVNYSMREWVKRTERITIYTDAVLFEAEGVEDPAKIAGPELMSRLGVGRVGERHIAAPVADLKFLPGAAAGRYPSFDYSRPLPAPVDARVDGILACDRERLHFRARRILDRVAEPAALDQWSLTRQSVEKLRQRGISLEGLLEQLADVVRGPLPPLLRANITGWMGRAGTAWLGEARLAHFTDGAVATLLRNSPGYDRLLARPISAQAFVVSEQEEETLRRLLTETGIATSKRESAASALATDLPPQELARVVRAPLSAPAGFDGRKFRAVWPREPAVAMEYAVLARAPLSVLLRVPRHGSDRINALPLTLIVLPDRAWVEFEVVRSQQRFTCELAELLDCEAVGGWDAAG